MITSGRSSITSTTELDDSLDKTDALSIFKSSAKSVSSEQKSPIYKKKGGDKIEKMKKVIEIYIQGA